MIGKEVYMTPSSIVVSESAKALCFDSEVDTPVVFVGVVVNDAIVGDFVGDFVGVSVGAAEGLVEGLMLGKGVGEKLGNVEGNTLGDIDVVGLDEGKPVGLCVGLDVGSSVFFLANTVISPRL